MKIRFYKIFKKSKYSNKTSRCNQGYWHSSIKEANYCNQLALLKKAGKIKNYKKEPHFDLYVNGKKICGIRPDFLVYNNNGTQEIHEVKASITMTSTWNLKRKLWEAIHPEIEYIVIR